MRLCFLSAGSLQLHKSGFRCIELDGCTDESGKVKQVAECCT